jgi:hypothetical protein
MSVTLTKKISAADLLGNVKKYVRENFEIGEAKLCFGVAGFCNAIEEGTSQYGDWSRFVGDFQATNYITGEIFRSEKCHVPSVLEAVLLRDLESMKADVKELQHSTVTKLTGEIEFAYTVQIIRHEDSDDGAVSYEYITTPRTEVTESDRVSKLSALIAPDVIEKPKALPKKK